MVFDKLNLVQPPSLVLMCSIHNKITIIVRKWYHGCKYCEYSINYRWSDNLRKSMYNFSRVLLKNTTLIEEQHLISMVNPREPEDLQY